MDQKQFKKTLKDCLLQNFDQYRDVIGNALGIDNDDQKNKVFRNRMNQIVDLFYEENGIVENLDYDDFFMVFFQWADSTNLKKTQTVQKPQIHDHKIQQPKPKTQKTNEVKIKNQRQEGKNISYHQHNIQGNLHTPQRNLHNPQENLYLAKGNLHTPKGNSHIPQGNLHVPQTNNNQDNLPQTHGNLHSNNYTKQKKQIEKPIHEKYIPNKNISYPKKTSLPNTVYYERQIPDRPGQVKNFLIKLSQCFDQPEKRHQIFQFSRDQLDSIP